MLILLVQIYSGSPSRWTLTSTIFHLQNYWGCLWKKEAQSLLISCLMFFQLAFLNWRTGRAVERRYGGLMSASVSTAQWSEIPGTLRDDFINPGLLVIQRSRMFLSLVGSFCTWVKAWSSSLDKRCSHCPLLVAEGKTRLFSQSMSGRLKSPPRMMVWFEFFGRRFKDLLNSSIFLIFEPGGR